MGVHVRGLSLIVTEALRAHVERRLAFALGRYADRIGRVTVRLTDVNGPRGGLDKQCRISVTLRPSGTVLIEHVDSDLYAAIDRAADRVGRSVGRDLARDRDLVTGTAFARVGRKAR